MYSINVLWSFFCCELGVKKKRDQNRYKKKNETAKDKKRDRRIQQFWCSSVLKGAMTTKESTVKNFPRPSTLRKYKNVFPSFQPTSVLHCTLKNGTASVSLLSRSIANPQFSFEGQASIFPNKQAYTCMAD